MHCAHAALQFCKVWAIDRQVFQKIMMCTRLQMQKRHMDFLQRSASFMSASVLSFDVAYETNIDND